MRVHGLCKILRKMDILQDVLSLTHKRSLDKYSEMDREDDFDEIAEAPEIECKCWHYGSVTSWDCECDMRDHDVRVVGFQLKHTRNQK